MTDLRSRILSGSGDDREIESFMAKAFPEPMSGCWLWEGTAYQDKYGRWKPYFCFNRKQTLAHRAAMTLLVGSFDPNAYICHHCDNPLCVNPDHLYVGDHASNMADMKRRNRTWQYNNPEKAKQIGFALGKRNTWSQGTGNAKNKLTEAQVQRIREDRRQTRFVAHDFGVDKSTIRRIRNGALWSSLPSPETQRND